MQAENPQISSLKHLKNASPRIVIKNQLEGRITSQSSYINIQQRLVRWEVNQGEEMV